MRTIHSILIVTGLIMVYLVYNQMITSKVTEETFDGSSQVANRTFVADPGNDLYIKSLNAKEAGDHPEKYALAEHMSYYRGHEDVGRSEGFDTNSVKTQSAKQQTDDYVTYAKSLSVDSDMEKNHGEWVKNRLRNDQNWTGRTMVGSEWENPDNTNWAGIRGRPTAVPIDRSRQKQVIDVDETQFPTRRRFDISSE